MNTTPAKIITTLISLHIRATYLEAGDVTDMSQTILYLHVYCVCKRILDSVHENLANAVSLEKRHKLRRFQYTVSVPV